MFVVLLSGLGFVVFIVMIDFILKRANIGTTKKLPALLVSGLIRNFMLFFLELVLCIWLHFLKTEETRGGVASMFFAVITVIVLIFVSLYAMIQMCPNQFRCGLFCQTFFNGLN